MSDPVRRQHDEIDALLDDVRVRRTTRRVAGAAAADAAFRATVEQRLKSLEGDLGEVKNRLNGLLFLVAGTVLAQLVLRLLHW